MENAILARGLVKRFGDLEAVKGIGFEVPVGSVFGFLGPNGAGKSTTIRMIHGLSPRTAGRLDVLGLDVATHGREIKRRIGVVPQENNLDNDMTTRENLLVFGRFFDITGAKLRDRVDELLAYVHLAEKADARADELSGGMRRRLHIARALLNDPELLVLDEPTTGLDPQSRALLWERIRALRREGRTILLTTHYMDEAEKLSDDIAIIDEGRIIARGAPAALIREHVGREVLEVRTSSANDESILARVRGEIAHHERVDDELRLFGEKGEPLLERVHAAGVEPEGHAVRRATLEDVFLKLTGRRLND
ncbi:MAG: lipooligosaccharide transport system ATP-binding protein [Thermoplasmata archaeon]|nr:lipooligosaccharide transport system ATP-binding protein [Thermoplasmata archaeon]